MAGYLKRIKTLDERIRIVCERTGWSYLEAFALMRKAKRERGLNSRAFIEGGYCESASSPSSLADRGASLPEGVTSEELDYLEANLPKNQVRRFLRNAGTVLPIVDQDSFYPEKPRKPRKERILDQMIWREKHGHYSNAYNEYGLDVVGFRDPDEYLDRYEFRELKSKPHHGRVNPVRYEMMSINKLWFYSYMEKLAPGLTPRVYFAFQDGAVVVPYKSSLSVDAALDSLSPGMYACKVQTGQKGKGFFKVEKTLQGKLLFNDGGDDRTSFVEAVADGLYILQDYVKQSETISRLSSASVNTIRVATLRCRKNAHVFYALIRMSSSPDAKVDNASQGGTFVGIDESTGRLRKYGYYDDDVNYKNIIETRHPVSGVKYEGYQIPFWNDIVALVEGMHRLYFKGFLLIGWDIALTDDGPVVLEINSNPCTKMAQIANGGLQRKWDELRVAD